MNIKIRNLTTMLLSFTAFVLGLFSSIDARAFKGEFGFSIEPTFLVFPAIAPSDSSGVALQTPKSALTLSPAAAFGLEIYPANYLSLTFRGGYAFAVVDTLIGEASFDNRTGNYWFRQSMAFGLIGARLETPHYWTPVTFGIGVQGGLGVLIQTDTELRNAAGAKLRATPPAGLIPVPIVALSAPISGRVSEQIRLGVEPIVYLVPTNPFRVGFGLNISLAFFFFV